MDADAFFDVKENENEVHVSPSSSDRPKKHDNKVKREAKGNGPVDLSTGVRYLSDEFEEFSVNSTNTVNAASAPVTAVGPIPTNSTSSFNAAGPFDNDVNDEEDVGAEADFSNLEPNISVSHIPTTRIHKDYHGSQIIGELNTASQTRNLPKGKRAIGSKWVFRNKKDERGIVVRNKARLVAQGHTQEEGIYYKEVFAPVAMIEAIWLFLAYASFMGFEYPDYPDKVYKLVKALYRLHQALRAWYETFANYLLENGFQRGKIDQNVFIKKQKDDILLVLVYVDDIIFGSTNNELCKAFEKLIKDKFQMSSMGELTFFLGLQFGLIDGKSASTPIDTEKPLLKDPEGEDVDVHIYRLKKAVWNDWNGICMSQMFLVLVKHHTSNGYQFTMSNSHQELTSPEQKVSGKDKSNPLMANNLPKIYQFDAKDGIGVTAGDLKLLLSDILFTTVSYKLMLFDLTKDIAVKLMLLDDADGVECLPNEEIFAELARMGSEKPPPKLTFYNAFSMPNGSRKFDFSKYIFDSMAATEEEDEEDEVPTAPTSPSPPQAQSTCTTLSHKVAALEQDKVSQALEILKLKRKVKKLEKKKGSKSFGLKRSRKMQEKHLDNIKKYQSLKRKPIFVAQARKNMIVYLKNMAGYKMEHFRGSESTQDTPTIDPKEMSEEDVQNMLQIIPVSEFKVEALQIKHDMYMLAEKDYPLSNGVMTLMLSTKLQDEEDSEMARDLVMKIFTKLWSSHCQKKFPLPMKKVPTTSEESSHCQKKRDAPVEKIALLLKSSSNCQPKSYDSYAKLVPHV
nr:hypothetical protein [Tanacetum cinerariifolium]